MSRSSDHFPVLLAASLALLGVLGAAAIRAADRGRFADAFSTHRSAPNGTRALFLLAQSSGVPVSRSLRDLELVDPNAQLLILGVDAADAGTRGPFATRLTADERAALLEHVASGHTLLYAPWDAEDDPLLDAIDTSAEPTDDARPRALRPAVPSPYTAGVTALQAPLRAALELPAGSLPLVDTDDGAVAMAAVPHGRGRVIVLTAPELASNRWLATDDNAQLWLSTLRTMARSGTVQFDEFHHGFVQQRSVAQFASRYGLQLAIVQLLVGLCVWAASLRRFGRPRTPPEDERRAAVDALSAISRIYREGRHGEHASRQILRALVQELGPLAGRRGTESAATVASALQSRGRKDLASALTEVAELSTRGGEGGVERTARAAALARRRLGGT